VPIDIAGLRRQLREHLGMIGDSQDEIPDQDTNDKTGADTFLNRSFWEICAKFGFREQEVIGSFPTVQGTNFYQIPTLFDAIKNIDIEDLTDFSHKPLDRIDRDVFSQKYENRVDSQSKPELYFRESNGIRVWRTPDNTYTLTIKYRATLADLDNNNTTPPVPHEWHEVIMLGGVWRAQVGVNRDYDGARITRSFQGSLIDGLSTTDVKEQEDSHRAGLEVIGLDGEL